MKYIKKLEQLGLSSNEARIYLACLELGNEKVSHIAEKAELPKSTTQDILRSLNKKGYVAMYRKKNSQYFSASEPIIFKDKINQQATILDALMPELNNLQRSAKTKATLRFFDSKEGFETVSREIISEANEILAFVSADSILEKMPEYFPQWAEIRAKNKITSRVILQNSKAARESKILDKKTLRQTKIVNTIPFFSTLIIWQNKVATISLGDKPSVIIIKDADISQSFRAMFELIWETIAK